MAAGASPLDQLQKRIGYSFRDPALLRAAMTHSSTGDDTNNERLEFLGDRVVNLVIAQELYRRFPDEAEGDLAKRHAALVQGKMLAAIARNAGLGAVIILSDAERAAGGNDNENIMADCCEALLGAVFLDTGLDECRRLVLALWEDRIDNLRKPPRDSKTALQEWAQARALGLPRYVLLSRDGPDHAPRFEVEVQIDGQPQAKGNGTSLRKAEKEAASILLAHREEMGL
jgi:ribonuclease-3